jgi:hypothetical protein
MLTEFLTIAVLQLSFGFGSFWPVTTPQTFQVREPFRHAPEVYADQLNFVATLVNLPGAAKKQSRWELSYQLFFIPEDKYQEALKRLPRGGSNPPPEHFHGRILLARGHRKITRLGTIEERTITLNGVPFKQKIPDGLRTKFGVLMTGYAVKIFDGELKTTVYLSGIFLTDPFETDPNDQKQVSARKTLYLNFAVTPDGTLNYSQLARKNQNTTRK